MIKNMLTMQLLAVFPQLKKNQKQTYGSLWNRLHCGLWRNDNRLSPHYRLNLGISLEVSGLSRQFISWNWHSLIRPASLIFKFQLSPSASSDMETPRNETGGPVKLGGNWGDLMLEKIPEEMRAEQTTSEEINVQDFGKVVKKHKTPKLVARMVSSFQLIDICIVTAFKVLIGFLEKEEMLRVLGEGVQMYR